jgi:hypothetical protein
MTGDGSIMKRRLRTGRGEFPVDCPVHDSCCTLHWRVRAAAGVAAAQQGPRGGSAEEGGWVLGGGAWAYDSRTDARLAGQAEVVDTGERGGSALAPGGACGGGGLCCPGAALLDSGA